MSLTLLTLNKCYLKEFTMCRSDPLVHALSSRCRKNYIVKTRRPLKWRLQTQKQYAFQRNWCSLVGNFLEHNPNPIDFLYWVIFKSDKTAWQNSVEERSWMDFETENPAVYWLYQVDNNQDKPRLLTLFESMTGNETKENLKGQHGSLMNYLSKNLNGDSIVIM